MAEQAARQANALQVDRPVAQRFDGRRFLGRIAANRAAFTPQGLAKVLARRPRAPSNPALAPIFFVGFPRSGPTLVERALAARPEIATTEERSPLTPAIRRLIGRGGTPSALDGVDEAQLSELCFGSRPRRSSARWAGVCWSTNCRSTWSISATPIYYSRTREFWSRCAIRAMFAVAVSCNTCSLMIR